MRYASGRVTSTQVCVSPRRSACPLETNNTIVTIEPAATRSAFISEDPGYRCARVYCMHARRRHLARSRGNGGSGEAEKRLDARELLVHRPPERGLSRRAAAREPQRRHEPPIYHGEISP